MCIDNPVPFHSDKPIVAYKVTHESFNGGSLCSLVAGNKYEIGCSYSAESPLIKNSVLICDEYDVGFHAYENLEDAQDVLFLSCRIFDAEITGHRIVEVELSDITHKGTERINDRVKAKVYVAKQCRFIRILPWTPPSITVHIPTEEFEGE